MEEELKRIKNKQSQLLFYFMLSLGLLGSLILLMINVYRWSIVAVFTPFLTPFIEILGIIIFAVCTLIVLLYFVLTKRSKKTVIPIGINLVVFILVFIIPFSAIASKVDFISYKAEREEVISMIVDGSLYFDDENRSIVQLPEKYQKLSKGGGEIVVQDNGQSLQILFFIYRGILNNYTGFIYTVDGESPNEQLFGKFEEVKELEENWYWVKAT